MTRSAPSDRTISTFLVLHTPVTSAPNLLAICTANVPTPPAAPLINTFCPGRICPLSLRPCKEVNAATGTDAACSNVTLLGFVTNADSEVHAYSAKAPRHEPKTSSPAWNRVTFLPTASTRPATSTPSRVVFGLRSPISPVPRGGGPAGRPDRGARPGQDRRRRNPGRAEEPHSRRPRPTPLRRSPPAALGERAPSGSRTRPGPARPPGPGRRHRRLAPGPARRAARSPYLRRTADYPYPGPRRRVLRRHRQPRHRAAQRRPRTTRSTAVMTTLAYTLSDSRVMLRRNLKHQLRYPSMTVMLIGIPIVLLLLFVYVFGGQLGAGLGAHEGRNAYLNYVVPGLLLITVASVVQGTSIMVAMDMTGGIIDRFRTMAIARASVLTGHVLGSLIQTLVAIAVLIGVAFGLGFRSAAGPLHWLAAIGILVLFAFALIWLAVALGLAAKSVETASNTPMILFLLLFLSSGFVATATMPPGLRQFAEYQPFPPVADTVRGLLSGAAIGDHAIAAIAWSIGIAVVAYLWAIRLYNRRRAAEPH